jgi:hypothetical protein
MLSANRLLMPRRALQTWQMMLEWQLSSFTFWSSYKPISRRRVLTSGEAESCLMQTTLPALTRLSGQTSGPAHSPSKITYVGFRLFTPG